MPTLPMPKFRPDLSARKMDVAEIKTDPCKAETDSSSVSCDTFAARRGHPSSTARPAPSAWKCVLSGVVGHRLTDPLQLPTKSRRVNG